MLSKNMYRVYPTTFTYEGKTHSLEISLYWHNSYAISIDNMHIGYLRRDEHGTWYNYHHDKNWSKLPFEPGPEDYQALGERIEDLWPDSVFNNH